MCALSTRSLQTALAPLVLVQALSWCCSAPCPNPPRRGLRVRGIRSRATPMPRCRPPDPITADRPGGAAGAIQRKCQDRDIRIVLTGGVLARTDALIVEHARGRS